MYNLNYHKRLIRLIYALITSTLIGIFTYFSFNFLSDGFAQTNEFVCSNPEFETGDLQCWKDGGDKGLIRLVQTKTVFVGNYAALIGDPFTTRKRCEGNLPLGSAWASYIITIPIQGEPFFSFNYRVFSYDEIVKGKEDRFDRFDVYIKNLTDSMSEFRILRAGSDNKQPSSTGKSHPCDFPVDDSNWLTATWNLSSVQNFNNPNEIYDLRGKTIKIIFRVFSKEEVGNQGWYNTWVFIDNLKLQPELTLTKSADPPGPVHEGDLITYTISYANTSLTTHSITITDQIPFNVILEPGSITPPGRLEGSKVVWNFKDVPPGTSDHVSFQARVPLLPSLPQLSTSAPTISTPPPDSPAYVLPQLVSCETTRFWANGVTRQPPTPNPHTIQVQIPPAAASIPQLEMWLLVRGQVTISPTIGGQPAQLIQNVPNDPGASLWATTITPAMKVNNQITVVTHNPCELNAIFLFDKNDPPFDQTTLADVAEPPKTFTYTVDIPSVTTQTIDVIMPFMDINYWDNQTPNTRLTTVTTQFNGQSQTIVANQPNLGNGLLLTQFPFNIGPLPNHIDVVTKTLTVTVDSEEFIYTLGPRICRPLYIENTAQLCSDKAGCISSTVRNIPETFSHPDTVYLPLIWKSSLN